MSLAQIMQEMKNLSDADLEYLLHAIVLEKLRRAGRVASAEETRLLQIINQPLAQVDRFKVLSQKWQGKGLSDEERAELTEITNEHEAQNMKRADAVRRYGALRGVSFEIQWKKMMGDFPPPLIFRE